jgi:predicted O-methyltransferase YrrM
MSTPTDLQILPGTPYSRYALPLEYMPSRDFAPRWGYSKPALEWMERWFRPNADKYRAFWADMKDAVPLLADVPAQYDEANLPTPAWMGVPYCAFDAMALATMIKRHRPRRYYEIGSGISTCFAYKAISALGLDTRILSIDPEPRAQVDGICDQVIRDGLETCDLSIFDDLEAGDILFFDGSHRSYMNSDVTIFFCELLPRIAPGVIIHVHDISLPYDYPQWATNWYWNEQYIMAAFFLGATDKIDPLLPTAYLCGDPDLSSMIYPLVDLPDNSGWKGGGAMWFTLTKPLV